MRKHPKGSALLLAGLALALFTIGTMSRAEGPTMARPTYLYRTTFVRAAPGKLLDLIALYKGRMAVLEAAGDPAPLWWRHTQGDQWDLMLITPMGSYVEYHAKGRVARRDKAAAASGLSWGDFAGKLDQCSSWKEDLFVFGPSLDIVMKAFEGTGYYHIEIFVSLPGKQEELYKEREMENVYAVESGRPYNMIFVRDQGASWDLFTLGCYRDLQHWAGSSGLTKEQREAAARKAGFKSADDIGPYMRTLIDWHRDTMGVAIK
ncbi:MAG: hypothetical protein ACXWFJ_06265 [Candidatus Aminicenantales bacterium]